MKVIFKNTETKYEARGLTERRIKGENSEGWILAVVLDGDFASNNIDEVLFPENISEITIVHTDENGKTTERFITGYQTVSACVIRYQDTVTSLEIQLTKGV
jgi:hypothetical protein